MVNALAINLKYSLKRKFLSGFMSLNTALQWTRTRVWPAPKCYTSGNKYNKNKYTVMYKLKFKLSSYHYVPITLLDWTLSCFAAPRPSPSLIQITCVIFTDDLWRKKIKKTNCVGGCRCGLWYCVLVKEHVKEKKKLQPPHKSCLKGVTLSRIGVCKHCRNATQHLDNPRLIL